MYLNILCLLLSNFFLSSSLRRVGKEFLLRLRKKLQTKEASSTASQVRVRESPGVLLCVLHLQSQEEREPPQAYCDETSGEPDSRMTWQRQFRGVALQRPYWSNARTILPDYIILY
jgi:hypothetical protein